MAGTPSMVGNGPWSRNRQSSQADIPIRAACWVENGVIIRL